MNCGRVSNQLSAYIDRELTGAEMLSVRGHLGDCDSCRAEYEALSRMKMMLGRLRTPEPSPDLVAAASRRLEQSALGGAAGSARPDAGGLLGALHRIARAIPFGETWAEQLRLRTGRFAGGVSFIRYATVTECTRSLAWPRLTVGVTTAALTAALLFTTIGWQKPRHPDALFATIPPQVALGQDLQGQEQLSSQTLEFDLVSEGGARDPFHPNLYRGGLPGGPSSLPWVPVSFESEGFRRLR
jgi:hypothetical protein